MKDFVIRPVEPTDLPALVKLCELHAIYEKASYNKEGKEELLKMHLFSPEPSLECLVATYEGDLAGYISFTREFSTWNATHYYHMDCLYLKEECRKSGLGRKLMNAMVVKAKELGIREIQWQTPVDNTNAIDFYHHIGAGSKKKERFFLEVS